MIVCRECGAQCADGAKFCPNNHFIEWSDATVTDPERDPTAQGGELCERPPPVQPAESVRRDTAPAQPAPVPTAGVHDLRCPRCANGNAPTRHFCRSCGMVLDTVPETLPLSWYRRLGHWLTGSLGRRRYAAGQRRPRRWRVVTRRLIQVVLAGAVFTTLAVYGPPLVQRGLREWRTTRQDEPLRAGTFAASSAVPDAPATHIGDLTADRYWAPAGPQPEGAWVEAAFAEPVHLRRLLVTPGVSSKPDKFVSHGRPRRVEVRASRTDGSGVSKVVELADKPGGQTYWIKVDDVLRVRLTVLATYTGAAAPPVAVAEVEFYGAAAGG